MNRFKVGDKVKCIDGADFDYYKGDAFKPYTGCTMIVKRIEGKYINGWNNERFELVVNDWDE